jgi:hypothetical protein
MQLRLIEFAEYAALLQDGRLVMAGISNALNTPKKPEPGQRLALGPLYLVAVTTCSIGEGTDHHATIRIVDEDEQLVVPEINLGRLNYILNAKGQPMRNQAIVALTGMPLPATGDIVFQFLVDGNKLGEATLYLNA